MKRKFISALLFGALLTASTSTFVSCKDYDGDITELRDNITTNATDLSSLVDEKMKNATAEIAALKTQAEALDAAYKSADAALAEAVRNATNDANGYADIQAAQAQAAAIAAAQELVNNAVTSLQASLDAANATISNHGETLAALVSADQTLQAGINAAMARANEAYTLAEQAGTAAAAASESAQEAKDAAAKVAEDLNVIKGELSGQINVLTGSLDEVRKAAEANLAKVEAQAEVIAQLKADNEAALAALSAKDTELKGLIDANQIKIAGLDAQILEAKAAAETALTDAKKYTDEEVKKVTEEITKANDLANDAKTLADNAAVVAERAQQTANDAKQAANEVKLIAAAAKTAAEGADAAAKTADAAAKAADAAAKAAQTAADNAQGDATQALADAAAAAQKAKDANTLANQANTAAGNAASAASAAQNTANGAQTAAEAAQRTADGAQTDATAAKAAADAAQDTADEALRLAQQAATQTKLDEVEGQYKAADTAIKQLITGLEDRVKVLENSILTNGKGLTAINNGINFNVNNLITGIIYQDMQNHNVFAQVGTSGAVFASSDRNKETAIFPYEKFSGYAKLTVGNYNIQAYAGEIYATINPTNVDASQAAITLENSLKNANTIYSLGTAEPAKGHLITRAAKSENGLWKLPVTSITSSSRNDNPADRVEKKALYALTTTYQQDTVDANGNVHKVTKKVYSHYAINKTPVAASTVTSISLEGFGENLDNNRATGVDIQFSALNGKLILGTNKERVYKKFIECISVKNSEGTEVTNGVSTFNSQNEELYKILAADNNGYNDTISVVCPQNYKNYTVTLKYYIWNYDGSVKTITKVVVFNKTLWGQDDTNFTDVPESSAEQTILSGDFSNFGFVKGDKCTNGTKWEQEAYSVEATTLSTQDAAIKGAKIKLQSSDKSKTYEAVTIGNAKANLTTASLDKIKQMSLVYDPSALAVDHEYNIALTFYDRNGFKVNIVNIKFTMTIPTGKPNPWHIAAAFDSSDKLTIAWATPSSYDDNNAVGNYKFSGSFYKVAEGFPTAGDPYSFMLNNKKYYETPGTNDPNYTMFKPSVMPLAATYNMVVPNAAINQDIDEEHTYSMTGGIQFYGLDNLISYNANGGFKDVFSIKFLSPIRYAIIGTKGHITGKEYAGITKNAIKVDYRKSVTVGNSFFKAYDPKEATATEVKFFENRDNRIVSTTLEFADKSDSNNALFSKIQDNGDGTYTLITTDYVSMTSTTNVMFKLTVKDVWDAVTSFEFPVTVVANR